MDRQLYLMEEVCEDSVADLIYDLMNIELEDNEMEDEYKDYTRDPIYLHIMTPGGCVQSGLALYDTIRQLKTPVFTIVKGQASSMGLIISLAGDYRLATENAFFMWHDISYGIYGSVQTMNENLDFTKRLRDKVNKIMLDRTLIDEVDLFDVYLKKCDWYMDVDEAKQFRIIHEVLRDPDPTNEIWDAAADKIEEEGKNEEKSE